MRESGPGPADILGVVTKFLSNFPRGSSAPFSPGTGRIARSGLPGVVRHWL